MVNKVQSLTVSFKLFPTDDQLMLIRRAQKEYINKVNELSKSAIKYQFLRKYSSKDIHCQLNSSIKNQLIRDLRSIYNKSKKSNYRIKPILKKPVLYINNQNWSIKNDYLNVPMMIDGKSKRIQIKLTMTNYQKSLIENASKIGLLRLVNKNGHLIAQIAIEIPIEQRSNGETMGIDLGILVPAVSYSSNGAVAFFGNGRRNKYLRRRYKELRKSLQKSNKQKILKKMANKEQRIMKDIDHKISREIIHFAIKNNVSTIKLEKLTNISKKTRTSRKNNYNLHTWSFYRLQEYIIYKANLSGINIELVNPAYTSQTCPSCQKRNKCKDRHYECISCGYTDHRDLVGAKNISLAPDINGIVY